MDRISLHSDAQPLGQSIAEKDETGAWTDYVFAGGKRIARVGRFAANPVAARQVVVHFTNDTCSACLGQPPFQDRNLQIDSIAIGGLTIPSSDPSVSFAGGYYVPPGLMATNGDLTFTLASPLTGPVSVQAWGTPDTGVYPHMQVLVNGALVSEYDVTASPQAYTAALTPTDPSVTTTFYLADHLGSAQMEFSSNGTPLSSSQLFPFGGEINPVPTTNHKFTGKERDTESGLDYFGARYFTSSMGRFMSPDWAEKAEPVPYAKLDNPQTLNLYAYVGNNPVSLADADGHCGAAAPIPCGGEADGIADREAGLAQVRQRAAALRAEEEARNKAQPAPAKQQNNGGSGTAARAKQTHVTYFDTPKYVGVLNVPGCENGCLLQGALFAYQITDRKGKAVHTAGIITEHVSELAGGPSATSHDVPTSSGRFQDYVGRVSQFRSDFTGDFVHADMQTFTFNPSGTNTSINLSTHVLQYNIREAGVSLVGAQVVQP